MPRSREERIAYLRAYRQRPEVKVKTAALISSEKRRAYIYAYNRTPAGRLSNRRRLLRLNYGIELWQWEAMLIQQAGRCDICNEPMAREKEPAVDHDHKTGRIRGLLCGPCNIGLDAIERPGYVAAAREYLDRHQERA